MKFPPPVSLGRDSRSSATLAPWRRMLRRKAHQMGMLALVGMILAILILLVVVLAPVLAPSDPIVLNMARKMRPPGIESLLGTDFFGRDILSRVLWGGRTTLVVGVFVIGLSAGVGIPLGLLAGQLGGTVDSILMRTADALLSFPSLVLAIAICSALGPNLTNTMTAVAIAYTPQFMRVARGQARAVVAMPYVEAARCLGMGWARLFARHVVPNCVGPLGVQASLNLGGAILATASLGFLGLGVQPPTPEWGADVANNMVYVREAPWAALWPGLAIVVTALSVNLLADGLVDYLNPRLRQR